MIILRLIKQRFLARNLLKNLFSVENGSKMQLDKYAYQYASIFPVISEIYYSKLYKKKPSIQPRSVVTLIMALDPYLEYIFEHPEAENIRCLDEITTFLKLKNLDLKVLENKVTTQLEQRVYELCSRIVEIIPEDEKHYFFELGVSITEKLRYTILEKNVELTKFIRDYSYPVVSLYLPYNWKMPVSEIEALQNLAQIIQLFDDITDLNKNRTEGSQSILLNSLTPEEFESFLYDSVKNFKENLALTGFNKRAIDSYLNFILRLGAVRLCILTRRRQFNFWEFVKVLVNPIYLLELIEKFRAKVL